MPGQPDKSRIQEADEGGAGEIPTALLLLRNRAGMSRAQVAAALKLAGSSSYQRYESAAFKKAYLPLDMAEKLADALEGKGEPPISRREVLSLAGIEDNDAYPVHIVTNDDPFSFAARIKRSIAELNTLIKEAAGAGVSVSLQIETSSDNKPIQRIAGCISATEAL